MAINIKFDLNGNPEPPIIILANRNGNKLGQLRVNEKSIDIKDSFNDASEFSFTINKYIDDIITPLWDKIVDFRLVYCKEWDLWFEIKVELDEETETVKTVFCTQLGQAELSQINLYDIHVNEEGDPNWNTENKEYKSTILYDPNNTGVSLLHRLLKDKAPHYSILHVDDTIKNIQRSFSFDDTSIYDAFQEISEEIGCLFVYHSNSAEDGKIQRTISVYDLQQNCLNPECKYRGEFTDKCPKCGSTNIDYNEDVFKDTLIFVTSDDLASEGIELVTDTDSVKNCFKLEAGDDLMTATIRNCNPNGTDYLWYLSETIKEDMSKELVNKLNSYDTLHKDYYNNHESKLDTNIVNNYNTLVENYKDFYNTKSTCINCDYEGFFENICPNCNSTSILPGKTLQSISATIKGYPPLMNAYYNTIDLGLYLKSGLMPTVEMSDTNAEEQAKLLTSSTLSPVAVNTENIKSVSLETANSAVLSMAKIIVKPTYKVEVKNSTLSADKVWEGSLIVTNYSDENDTAESQIVRVVVNNDTETFVKQKIEKVLNKENTDDYSISGLFKMEYAAFCTELRKYALNPLKSFYDACDSCLNILIDSGAGNKVENPDLYTNLYVPYYKKSSALSTEIKVRENEIAIIEGKWNNIDEKNPKLITKGLQQYIEERINEIQDKLNFEEYLGEELWIEFCAYRREDTYSNENYISDGLDNAQLFKRASEFYEVAENEIYKSAELQHSISTSLNNLLAIDKFKPLVDSFNVGNWIRVRVDDKIFKLRLLEYEIDFDDFENISVEFSDVTKIKNGITDVKEVIEQASSMATNYSSIQRQADKGNRARNTIDQWITDGLNTALIKVQSNNREEVTMTENGLLCRSYDDITGGYSPEQLKITHNIMVYTDNNWQTAKQAIGKYDYKYYDKNNNNFVDKIGYGMNADFVNAGIVSGSQIVGGDIYSENYSTTNETGSYIDLIDGTFSFGGGALKWDGENLIIKSSDIPSEEYITQVAQNGITAAYIKTLGLEVGNEIKMGGNATISWNNVSNQPTILSGNDIKNTVITKDYIETLKIKAGSVDAENISGTTITGKTISGGSITIGDKFSVDNYGNLKATEADVSGKIIATEGHIGSDVLGYGGWSIVKDSIFSHASFPASVSDYSFTAADARDALLISVGKEKPTEKQMTILDVNGDGKITAADARYILRRSVNLDTPNPIDKELNISLSTAGIDITSVDTKEKRASLLFSTGADSTYILNLQTGTTNTNDDSSDQNVKHSIELLSEEYDLLFDNLVPRRFKYNHGTSNRYHTGFIAQEVVDAINKSNLTTSDFAAVMHLKVPLMNGAEWALRKDEIVALNTWQIQKLKNRIDELEKKIGNVNE